MPRHKDIYDKDLKETPEWKFLYAKWCLIRKSQYGKEFERFNDFYSWSLANGFVMSAKLTRLDKSKPYSPENCQWIPHAAKQIVFSEEDRQWIAKWNKAANRIRRHYGMKPLPGTEVGNG